MEQAQENTPRMTARIAALMQAGYAPKSPPLHAIEAHPLAKLAFLLSRKGLAGLDGAVSIENGLMDVERMSIHTPSGTVALYSPGTMRIEIDQIFPEEVAIAMTGQNLHHVIEIPVCGDDALDGAIKELTIERSAMIKGSTGKQLLQIVLHPHEVVEMEPTPEGEDDEWKHIQPIPRI